MDVFAILVLFTNTLTDFFEAADVSSKDTQRQVKRYETSQTDVKQQKKNRRTDADVNANKDEDTPTSSENMISNTATTTVVDVEAVIDGDTIVISKNGKKETLRLIGIDTPETNHPVKLQECFGKEATQKARDTLAAKSVRLKSDPRLPNRGTYGRLLRYVYLPDGQLFNQLMIHDGYAYEYTYNVPYTYQDTFKNLQRAAQSHKRGLWAPDVCDNTTAENTQAQNADMDTNVADALRDDRTECGFNAYDCSDFTSQRSAQATFEYCGGPNQDPHWLDGNEDGRACENLIDE